MPRCLSCIQDRVLAAVHYKTMALLLDVHFLVAHYFWGFRVRYLFCFAVVYARSRFATISLMKRQVVAIILSCHVMVVVRVLI